MKSLQQLNDLEISKRQGIVIEPQKGYVPPPLVGIWARWPYFHNNSVATLCDVLTRSEERPMGYWAREADDRNLDFDFNCNGYPRAQSPKFTHERYYYNTLRPGMSAYGHDEAIFLEKGREKFSRNEKMALIRYLQTL